MDGIDYNDSFSYVDKHISIHVLLSLDVLSDLKL